MPSRSGPSASGESEGRCSKTLMHLPVVFFTPPAIALRVGIEASLPYSIPRISSATWRFRPSWSVCSVCSQARSTTASQCASPARVSPSGKSHKSNIRTNTMSLAIALFDASPSSTRIRKHVDSALVEDSGLIDPRSSLNLIIWSMTSAASCSAWLTGFNGSGIVSSNGSQSTQFLLPALA